MEKIKKIRIGDLVISLDGIKCVKLEHDYEIGSDYLIISYESGLKIKIRDCDGIGFPLDSNYKDEMQKIADKIMELAIPGNEILNIDELI